MELALESVDSGSSCDFGRSCVYTGTIAWAGPTQPLPMEHDPSAAFVRLFGDGTADAKSRAGARTAEGQHPRFAARRGIAPADVGLRARSIAAVELSRERARRRAAHSEGGRLQSSSEPSFDRPAGVPDTFEQHARLMFDLQWLAYQGDVTRVVDVHDRPRVQRPHLSGDRRAGCASSDLASPARSAPHGEVREDQPLSRLAVLRVRREAERHSRRRRLAARSRGDHLRRRHERRQRPRSGKPADPASSAAPTAALPADAT